MGDPSSFITVGKLLAVIILVLVNGFFVAAEFSLVAVRRSRVQQLVDAGHPLAPALSRATRHLDAYLAATQLGITIASIGLGWVGEPVLAGIIEPALHFLPNSWELVGVEAIAIALAFSLITGGRPALWTASAQRRVRHSGGVHPGQTGPHRPARRPGHPRRPSFSG